MDSVAIAQLAQPTSRPLSAVLRERIDGDAELRRLRGELKNWLMRGLGAFYIDGRRIAARRLRELAPGVPRLIQVAGYTVEKVAAAYATDPRTAHLQDAWAAIWARRIEGRLAMLLARVFDQLRGGEIVATGRLAANPLAPIVVPPELWDAPATVLDPLAGDILLNDARAFVDVAVSSPAPRAPLPEATARRLLMRFAEEIQAVGRMFVTSEAAELLQRQFPGALMASERQVTRLLRENRPASWAHKGRRRAVTIPSIDELVDAAAVAGREIDH